MKYFSINELVRSNTASMRGIDNNPSETVKSNLTKLINNLLDPIRERWGKPIHVNSGYRCKALNKAVGGVWNSEHLSGCAADISVGSKAENEKLFQFIVSQKDLKWRQIINEHHGSWVHISYNERDNKRQILHV